MNSQVKKLTFTALMAAMITIFTAYICHIPVGQEDFSHWRILNNG